MRDNWNDDGPRLTPKYERELREKFENDDEAHVLLGLINAEFTSDPMSVQCFDLRVVERVRKCVETHKRVGKSGLFV